MTDNFDMDRFRLRRFVDILEAEGELERVSGAKFSEIARRLDGVPKAVLFENLPGCEFPVVGNIMGGRKRIALSFGVEVENLRAEITRRLENRPEVVEVDRAQAPVQQVVVSGADVDLTELPIHVQHGRDGGPYISAALDCAVDPITGRRNTGVRRLMLRTRNTTHIDLTIQSDLRMMYLAALERGERLPISVAVGCWPTDYFVAGMALPGDEFELMSSYRGGPVPLVKSISNDVFVPADAEWVLEGYLGEEGYCESEGPYGEFFGYYGGVKTNPVFHVTTITRRHDALFQTITYSGRHLEHTDGAPIAAIRAEGLIWRALQPAIREPVDVHVTPASSGLFNARIAIRQRARGEVRNAIAAAFSVGHLKNIFVVDPDIDIRSDSQMDFALATRFQPHRDLVVQHGFRTIVLDPSLNGELLGSKAGYDLTFPFGETGRIDYTPTDPPTFKGARFPSVRAALEHGPKYFEELAAALGSDDGREIPMLLDELRREGVLGRDTATGRYTLAAKSA